ncbi:MAG: PAS domain S-box protein, partial [Thermodesulfovibrionales bacterium]
MNSINRTREELARELDAMRLKLEDFDRCRNEFEGMRERYEKLLDAAPDAMVFVNRDSRIVLVNAQAEALFGYRQEELADKALEILIPPRFREGHRRLIEDYFANPRLRTMGSDLKISALRKDGTEFRADISLSPLKLEGELLATAAIRDVTERVTAQELIERNYHIQRVINAILKVSLEAIPFHDQLERALDLILSVPDLSLQSKGSVYLAAEGTDELVLEVSHGMTEAQLNSCGRVPLGKCLCGRAASSCEVVFTDCVGEGHDLAFEDMFPHGHYCVPIVSGGKALGLINVYLREGHRRDQAEEAFLIAVADTIAGIIERNRVKEAQERLQKQLLQSEKLAALGRVAANVAHEIRNPLTSVGGFAKRLQKRVQEGTPEREYADIITSEVAVLENILRDVLSFSRVAALHPEKQEISSVVDGVVAIYEERCLERGITVVRSYAELPEIFMDREQVREVIGNIVLNALDAMPSGGRLSIATGREVLRDEPYAFVRIGDTGGGIAGEIADK